MLNKINFKKETDGEAFEDNTHSGWALSPTEEEEEKEKEEEEEEKEAEQLLVVVVVVGWHRSAPSIRATNKRVVGSAFTMKCNQSIVLFQFHPFKPVSTVLEGVRLSWHHPVTEPNKAVLSGLFSARVSSEQHCCNVKCGLPGSRIHCRE